MAKEFWLNLPVKSVSKSRAFFTQLGFKFNPRFGEGDNCAGLMMGEKNVIVMLFEESAFKMYIPNQVANPKNGTEVLLSFDAQSKEEVDEMTAKAVAAGGTSNHKPSPMTGWMYGSGFTDLDGHNWNILYMDMSKMPGQ